MTVDVRTRRDGTGRSVDPAAFFEDELPDSLAEVGAVFDPDAAGLRLRPLTVAVDDDAWTLTEDEGRLSVRRGPVEGSGNLRLDPAQLSDLVSDQVTPMGWFSSGRLDLADCHLAGLLDWWLLLRAALDGVIPHQPGDVDLVDGHGAPLDLHRSFGSDDDPQEMRRFLEAAGYLHITGVFTEDEMAEVAADMDRAAPTYRQGDGHSWWAKTGDGEQHLVRMQSFDTRSPTVSDLVADNRLQRIADVPGAGHQWGARADNRIEALFKPVGVVEGISDVPWHKDCSLGRHSYECCSVTVGVSVTGADSVSGQLRVVAGSHRALVWPAMLQRGLDLPVVDLPTQTGDLTVHLSCTLHMAQPPVDRERLVLYTGFGLPPRDPDEGAAAAAARISLRDIREAAPVTVSQPASAVPAT